MTTINTILTPNLQQLLVQFDVIPVIDSQVGKGYGKLRALPLIKEILRSEISCFRPRAVFVSFPGIQCTTPRKAVSDQYRVYVASQLEEQKQGLIQSGMLNVPFVALVDSYDFLSRLSDRGLVGWAGNALSFEHIYKNFLKENEITSALENTKNIAFQRYAKQLSPSEKGLQLRDLFDPSNRVSFTFPWFESNGWLHKWTKLYQRHQWFRNSYRRIIWSDLCHWIDDKIQLQQIYNEIMGLLEGKFNLRPQSVLEWIEANVGARNSKL